MTDLTASLVAALAVARGVSEDVIRLTFGIPLGNEETGG